MSKALSRYLPFAAFFLALILLLLFVPSTTSPTPSSSGTLPPPPGMTPKPVPGSAGTTVGGITCGSGVRQIPWSDYAPECVPAWHGNNGGATAPGVTRSTITVVYRQFSSTDLTELYSFLPPSVIGTNQEGIDVLRSDIKVFNKYFELYGRHVVLKVFTGQGDLINEVTGSGLPEAEADAATAKTLGAFADLSLADTSQFYVNALANEKIIAFPLDYQLDAASYLSEEPYVYTMGPDCTKSNQALAAMVGNGMAGLPAIYAGDPSLQDKTRSFGIFYDDTPYAHTCEQQLVADLARRGVTPAAVDTYTFSATSLAAEMTTAVEQMKAAGVTTVIDPDEDPVTPGLVMAVAQADGYHPEWLMTPFFTGGNIDADAIQRQFADEAPQETDHLIEPGLVSSPAKSQEDYTTFEKGSPGGTPLPTYSLAWFYAPVMLLFSAVQAAGPDLTPQTFDAAFHKLTASAPGGMFGQWTFGPKVADPASSFQIVYWDPDATSDQDGLQGALEACNDGKVYTYSGAGSQIPRSKQLTCYGR